MKTMKELLQGNAQRDVLDDLKALLVAESIERVQEIIECHRTIELADEINSICEANVEKALEAMKIVQTLANEAGETLDFLVKRNASRESIAGMSVLVYHANNAYYLLEEIAESIQGSSEVGL